MIPAPLRITLALFLTCLPARAATIAWDGGGDGTSFSDAANWSGDVVPGGGDHAAITLAGTYTVRLSAPLSIAGITLGGTAGQQTLDATGFRLDLGKDSSTVAVNGVFVIGGVLGRNYVALAIDGPLAVYGRMDWGNGDVYAATYYQPPNGKVITIATGGTMRWISGGDRTIDATLDNHGTLHWEAGDAYYNQGYTVVSSGLFDIALTANATFGRTGINSQGPWVFTNTGTVRRSGTDTATIQVELRTIGGFVDVQSGTLLQNYTSRWERAHVNVAAGALLQLMSNRQFEAHTIADTLNGTIAGTFLVHGLPNGYYATLTGDPTTGGYMNIGGTGIQLAETHLGGVPDAPTGTYSPAPVNLGLMRLTGGVDNYVDGAFVNRGHLVWESGRLVYSNTASFANERMFEWAMKDTVDFITSGINGSRPGPFINTDTVLMTGTGMVTSNVEFNIIHGTVAVLAGKMVLEWDTRWDSAWVDVARYAWLQLAGYLHRHVIAGRLEGIANGTFVVAGTSYGYSPIIMADTVRGGTVMILSTGLKLSDFQLGVVGGPKPLVNQGYMQFVGGDGNQYINGDFRNESDVDWQSGNLQVHSSATITNTYLFEFTTGAQTLNGDLGGGACTIINEHFGVLWQRGSGTTTLRASIINHGHIFVGGDTVAVGSTFNGLNSVVNATDGIISGGGTLDLHEFPQPTTRLVNDGTVAPGTKGVVPGTGAPGDGITTLTIIGPMPYHLLAFDVVGTLISQHDHLIVSGYAPDLAGVTMTVRLGAGYVPQRGDSFHVVIGSVANRLLDVVESNASVHFIDIYPPTGVWLVLDTAAASEPGIDVWAPVLAAHAGDRFDLPVTVVATPGARSAGAAEVTVRLGFNATMLGPIEATPTGTIAGGKRSIGLRIPLSSTSDTTRTVLRCIAALGNDSVTVLSVDSARSNVPALPVTPHNGQFTLLDLCREGGARLLNPDGVVTMSKARPNPAAGAIALDVNLIETGPTRIVLCDLQGTIVRTLVNAALPRGRHSIALATDEIPSGRYFIVLTTPTMHLFQQVEIVR